VKATKRARLPRKVRVNVSLHVDMVILLDVTAKHLGKSRSETMADGLRCLFAAIPRPDD
jgi:hypothetical protein